MVYSNKDIVLNELIGLKARVIQSLDRKQRGLTGTVIDETKNTVLIDSEGIVRKVIKKISVFRFYTGKKSFVVKGEEINFRPHERIEKAYKFYKMRD